MTPESPSELAPIRGLYVWLASIVLLLLGFGIWSNHFNNAFHYEDFDTIVNNRLVHQPSNLKRFFSSPVTFSVQPEFADYKPLLLTSFAIDSRFAANSPAIFHLDSFAWFAFLVFSLYLLFRLLPGARPEVALFAAALFSVHPVIAETLNYISQRGQIMGAAGAVASLVIWIFWPGRLPRRLPLDLNRVPQNWWQDQVRQHGPQADALYRGLIRLPIPWYLIPLIPALFCDPSAAIFAPLLLVYILLYEGGRNKGRVLPAAIICGIYWLLQTVVVLRFSPLFRMSPGSWYLSQTWEIARYLFSFVVPIDLAAFSGKTPSGFILAVAGVAVVAFLVWVALRCGKHTKTRGIAFGIWWFLIALLPSVLVPQRTVEAWPRMFIATAGLAFALASAAFLVVERLWFRFEDPAQRWAAFGGISLVLLSFLATLAFMTWQRNEVWATADTLWPDLTRTRPKLALGYLGYGIALLDGHEDPKALANIRQAASLTDGDAPMELRLAQTFDRMNLDLDAELHFRRSITAEPRYSGAYAYFGQWLLAHQRRDEALTNSKKALSLNSADLISRHTLLDIYSELSDWNQVAKIAREALELDPDDPAGQRSLTVATASFTEIHRAEEAVRESPKVDDYLSLSVLYFHNRRYEDCIRAAQKALELRPNLAEAWANMATAYHTIGKDDDAINALREVVRLRPDMSFAKTDLEILLDNKAEAARQRQMAAPASPQGSDAGAK